MKLLLPSSSSSSSSSLSSSILLGFIWWSSYLVGTTNGYRCSRCSSGSGSPSFPIWSCELEPPPTAFPGDFCHVDQLSDSYTYSICEQDWYDSLAPSYGGAECECSKEIREEAGGLITDNCFLDGSTCNCQNVEYDWPEPICPSGGTGSAYLCTDILYVCWNVVPPEVLGLIDDNGDKCTIDNAIQEVVYCDDTTRNSLRGGKLPINAPPCGDFCTSGGGCPNDKEITEILDIWAPDVTGALINGFCDYGDGWRVDGQYDYRCPEDITIGSDPGECGAILNYPEPQCKINYSSGDGQGSYVDVYNRYFTETFEGYFSGEDQYCSFKVTVVDVEAPTIVCPTTRLEVNLVDRIQWEVNYDLPIVHDNCELEFPLNPPLLISGPPLGSSIGGGSYTTTYKVVDAENNKATCSFDIVVSEPPNPPTITCPNNINIEEVCEDQTVVFDPPIYDGNGVSLTTEPSDVVSGLVFSVGSTTTITHTATDTYGRTATCSFDIVISEPPPPPTITCPNYVQIEEACEDPSVEFNPPIFNGFGVSVTTEPSGVVSGSVFPVGSTTTITHTATDFCGQVATCSFDIVISEPPPPPTITCPSSIKIEEACEDSSVEFDLPSFTGVGVSVTTEPSGVVSESIFAVGTTTAITHTATDSCGREATCSFNIVVSDLPQLPSIECPENIEVATCEAPIVQFDPPIYDGISVSLTTDPSQLVSGSVFPVRSTTPIAFIATDSCGREAACSFDVVVSDPPQLPTITCPDNIEVEACEDPSVEFGLPSYDGIDASLTTDTPGVVSGSIFTVGTTTAISFTATDSCGRKAACSFDIVVSEPPQLPSIECPQNIQVETCDDPTVEFDPPIYDGFDVSLTTDPSGLGSGSVFSVGTTTTITHTATDTCGREAACSFNIVVSEPPQLPTITCPNNIEVEACEDPAVEFGLPIYDGIDVSLTTEPSSIVSGSIFAVGTTTPITFTATDSCGREATCSFDIVVSEPPQLPSITCPENIGIETCMDPTVEFDPPIYDGFDVSLTTDPSGLGSGSVFSVGTTTTIMHTATDTCGREASCSFDIVVSEPPQLPTITCPNNIVMEEVCVDTAVEFDDPIYDGIDVSLTTEPSGVVSGSVFSVGTTTPITFTATDACNREASCTLQVTLLRDSQDPTVTCSMMRECGGGGGCHFRAEWTATDNCGEDLATTGYVASECFPEDIPIVSNGQMIDYFPIVKDSETVDWNKGGCPAQGTKTATLFLEVMDGAGNTAGCEAVEGFSNRNKVRGLRSLQKRK